MNEFTVTSVGIEKLFLFHGQGIFIYFKNACPTREHKEILTTLMNNGRVAVLPISFEDFTVVWNKAKGANHE